MSSHVASRKRAREMISRPQGQFELPAGRADSKNGNWTYKPGTDAFGEPSGELHDAADGLVGRFTYAPISRDPQLFMGLFTWGAELNPAKKLRCIGVTNSEIMKHVQLPTSEGCYFVLPSQLNGAEYPSDSCVVRSIKEYRSDNTGGPRGQLAVHPAAGQFVLDNAAHRDNPAGLNAVDQILLSAKDFDLQNGYLRLPMTDEENKARKMFESFVAELCTLRPLVMHDVPASGLTPDKQRLSEARHNVSLVYASAVPVDAYLNYARSAPAKKLHSKVAEAVLVAQYYGAIREAARQGRKGAAGRRVKVFLLPLGGGVFNNSWESIARAMAQAVELLAEKEPELYEVVEVEALAWEGSPTEKTRLEDLLTKYGKFRAEAAAEEAEQRPQAADGSMIVKPESGHGGRVASAGRPDHHPGPQPSVSDGSGFGPAPKMLQSLLHLPIWALVAAALGCGVTVFSEDLKPGLATFAGLLLVFQGLDCALRLGDEAGEAESEEPLLGGI